MKELGGAWFSHSQEQAPTQLRDSGRPGAAGAIVDMKELGVWEPYEVKAQTLKTAVESAMLLLRIDDIVSGIQKKDKMAPGQSKPGPQAEDPDQARRPARNHGAGSCTRQQQMVCLLIVSTA